MHMKYAKKCNWDDLHISVKISIKDVLWTIWLVEVCMDRATEMMSGIYIYIYKFWSLYLVLHTDWQELNFESIQTIFPVIGIPIIKIKWFWDHIYNWNSCFSMMSSVYWDSVQDIKHVFVMICYGIVCEQGKSENTAYACQPLSKKNILWIGLWYCCMDAWHLVTTGSDNGLLLDGNKLSPALMLNYQKWDHVVCTWWTISYEVLKV